jgi:hydrogenase maturation protein HypF
MATAVPEGRQIDIEGTVQGVGFRPWIYRLAVETGVRGRVRNDAAGVHIDVFGTVPALETFLDRLRGAPPPAAAIRGIHWSAIPPEPVLGFTIAASALATERRVSIPPDLATCPDCLREVFDPADRRYRYPFTNCTNCGPRFTIARDIPYDRAATTMAPFEMCPRCRAEYEDPADRRFHAQPNACPACGPKLWAGSPEGERIESGDPIHAAALALDAGLVVAVKGLGGFHLACDAGSGFAVERLRRRKRRDARPFAVMVRDLAEAERVARPGPAERELLESVERPIVLMLRREGSGLAAEVAPASPLTGVMLPYTPLHHLLLAEAGRPLVMTSGNLSEEPIARTNGEALDRLREVADLFLFHDREIETRCDDSVARVVVGAPMVLRRSRGWVPRPVPLERPMARPVLACGAHLKNTFCLAAGDSAWLGPHVGDLETVASLEAYQEAIPRLERFLGVRPEVIAHDLHPSYVSTAYALARPEAEKVGVQHHHAHVASLMAEHGLSEPILGLAWDGTGFGLDGTAWGGEFLLADFRSFRRVAAFRPVPLAGSDLAIREVWRIALALLDDAFAGDPPLAALRLFEGSPAGRVAFVRRMIAAGLQSPLARGVGRYFDALGALGLGRAESRFEGQIATEWNHVADPGERRLYSFSLNQDLTPWEVDLRPLVRGAATDLLAGRSPATVSARFHNTLAAVAEEVARAAAEELGGFPVGLTGGCFQNPLLTERVLERLAPGFPVLRHREVPPGDGGLALGQALVADAAVRGEPVRIHPDPSLEALPERTREKGDPPCA